MKIRIDSEYGIECYVDVEVKYMFQSRNWCITVAGSSRWPVSVIMGEHGIDSLCGDGPTLELAMERFVQRLEYVTGRF